MGGLIFACGLPGWRWCAGSSTSWTATGMRRSTMSRGDYEIIEILGDYSVTGRP
jgi:hypothetical protein